MNYIVIKVDVKIILVMPKNSLLFQDWCLFWMSNTITIMSSSATLTSKRLALLLLLLACFLRLYRLGYQELRGDEAFSYLVATRDLADIGPFLIRNGEPHPPLHFYLMRWSQDFTGHSEFSLRYIGAMASLLAIPALYHIGRLLAKRPAVGLALMGLGAINPLQIWAAQDARHQYALVAGFATLATAVFLLALQHRTRNWWLGYALTTLLTMYAHYYGIFPLLAHGAYLLVALAQQDDSLGPITLKTIGTWVFAGALAALPFLPWLYLHAPALLDRVNEPTNPKLSHHLTAVGTELLIGSTFGHPWGRWLFLGAAITAIFGYRHLVRTLPASAALLAIWLLSTTLGLWLVRFGRGLFNNFYIIPASPAWLLLILLGLMAFWHGRVPYTKPATALLTTILLGAMSFSLYNYYFIPDHSKSWGYRQIAAHLQIFSRPGDIIVSHYPDPNVHYYFRDLPHPREMVPPRPGMSRAEIEAYFATLATENERIWFIPAHKSAWDPEDIAFNWLDYENVREQEATYNKLTLLAYRPPRTMSRALQEVIGRELKDELSLESLFVTVDGKPVDITKPIAIASSQRMRVNINWQALRNLETSYTVFVHLLGDDGQLVAQHDGIPVRGTRPTNYWQTGETHWDLHELFLPNQINVTGGTLYIGLYTTADQVRQPFTDGLDTWPVTRIQFTPLTPNQPENPHE